MTDPVTDRGPLALGIDAGGTKIAAGVVDAAGRILARAVVPTPRGPEAVESSDPMLSGLLAASRQALAAARQAGIDREIAGVGAGLAGLVGTGGNFVWGPNFPLRHADVSVTLDRELGLSASVENDANVAAWAEYLFGAGERCTNMLLVTLGTGIGGGIVLGGRLFGGAHGFAGEFGHMTIAESGAMLCTCGKRGCWETVGAGRALDHAAQVLCESPGGERIASEMEAGARPGVALTKAALAGDAVALDAIDSYADLVASGLQNLVVCFDPARIVIGGGVSNLGEVLFVPLRTHLARRLSGGDHRPAVPVVGATLGADAGIAGAAALVLHPSTPF